MTAGPSGGGAPPHLPTAAQGGPPSIAPPPGSGYGGKAPPFGQPPGAPESYRGQGGPGSNGGQQGGYERDQREREREMMMGERGARERERGMPSNGSEGSQKRLRMDERQHQGGYEGGPPSPEMERKMKDERHGECKAPAAADARRSLAPSRLERAVAVPRPAGRTRAERRLLGRAAGARR
jgi:hypothetical protein